MADHEVLIVRAESQGMVGYGEVPAMAAPVYTYETVHTAWHVIRDVLAPRLKGQEIAAPGPISELFSFVRGHPMAKAGIEMAVLDLFGKAHGREGSEFEQRSKVNTPLEILRSLTSVNAEILMQGKDLGRIAPGALADMIALDGDPLNDISVLERPDNISLVMIDGAVRKNAARSSA